MSPLQAYHSLLLSNLSAVQTIESSLSNITWLLPGRFQDSEIASEGLYAGLNVISSYHDSILTKHLSSSLSLPPHPFPTPGASHAGSTSTAVSQDGSSGDRIHPLLPPPSDHTRYTRYWSEQSSLYKRAAQALSTIRFLELLIEMVAKKKLGDRRRWKVVLWIETIKTFLKLTILFKTGRPVLSQPTPQREVDLASLPPQVLQNSSPMPNSEPVTPQLPAHSPLRGHLLPMAGNLPEEYLQSPLQLLPRLEGRGYLAEAISCSIGLVHVLLLLRSARRHTTQPYSPSSLPTLSRALPPFLIPLLLSLIARHFRHSPSRSSATTPLLLSHYAQQDRALALRAFMTGPMWIGWTRPKVVGFAKALERIPLVGLVGELVEGYLPMIDDYFFYTSSSH